MSILQDIVRESAALGAAQMAERLGLSAGEISQRQAKATYGKWFTEAERAGKIHPVRIDQGRNGTRHYRVVEIQELKTAELVRAELQLTGQTLKTTQR